MGLINYQIISSIDFLTLISLLNIQTYNIYPSILLKSLFAYTFTVPLSYCESIYSV